MSDAGVVCDRARFRRKRLATLAGAALALATAMVMAPPSASSAPRDLATMSRDEIVTLQRRLVDAGCFKGEADGRQNQALASAVKACPDQDPVLRIETGMHTTGIKRIGVDASCRIAATGADDKTVRLWSLPDGQPLRTQRLPLGEGDNGKIFAVAMSPDGRTVAAAGWDAGYARDGIMGIYLFDAATGRSIRRIGQLKSITNHMTFSPDGARLAVTLGGTSGLRIIDVASGRDIVADTDYADQSYGAAFGPRGELFVSGFDGFLRRYGPDGRRTHKVAGAGGKNAYGVSVSTDGSRVALGYFDKVAVEIYDAANLRRLGTAETSGVGSGVFSNVAWTATGRLLSGGTAQKQIDGRWRTFIQTYDILGKRARADLLIGNDTVFGFQTCGDAIAFSMGDPGFGLIRTDGSATTLARGRVPDLRGKLRSAFTVSPDGTRLRFGLGWGLEQPVLFDLGAGAVSDGTAPAFGLVEAVTTGLPIANWENTRAPTFGGKPMTLRSYETSRAVAIRADRSGFALGGGFSLRAYKADGTELWPARDVPSETWGVNLARNGELIVAAYGDGTIRWHRWSDGQELLALFIHKDDRRFVLWTPAGYYMASPGAEDLIGWHVNRGWEQQGDFFPASRFRERFNRPDIVRLVLETLDEGRAVTQANAASRKREDAQPLAARLPPVVRITSPTAGSAFAGGEVQIGYELRSPSGLPVDKVDVLVDGRPLNARGFDRRPPTGSGAVTGTLGVTLPAADVEVALVARSGDLASEPATLKLRLAGAPANRGEALLKPKLYALVVGVSDYVDPTLKLGYAAKDANDFAAALRAQSGGMYGAVEIRLVTNRDVTRSALVDGLEWLEKEVTSRDVGILFLAGHGITDNRQGYWFLPSDATPERVRVAAVSQDEIRRSLGGLAGKALLFLDTCHAGRAVADGGTRRGGADINAVVNEFAAAENGIVAFASSTGREVSLERDDWGNGAFTKALLEGLVQGKADLLGKGTITLSQLDAFLANRVKELTGGTQHPSMTRPATVPDYPIALVRR